VKNKKRLTFLDSLFHGWFWFDSLPEACNFFGLEIKDYQR